MISYITSQNSCTVHVSNLEIKIKQSLSILKSKIMVTLGTRKFFSFARTVSGEAVKASHDVEAGVASEIFFNENRSKRHINILSPARLLNNISVTFIYINLS